jgi:HlyD family secretion protein
MYLAQIPRFIIDALLLIALVLFAAFYSTQGLSANNFIMTVSVYGVAGLKLLPAFQNIFYFTSEIQARSKYLNNIVLLFKDIKVDKVSESLEMRNHFAQSIQFKNVSFSYGAELKKAIANLSIEIQAGKKIAIIGPSGSGKSTFIDLLLGFIRPLDGELIIDGKSLKEADLINYRKYFSYVPQKLYLLDASLKENIIFGANVTGNSDTMLSYALEASQVNSFLDDLSHGINTSLSESNLSLSGGQKQAVGIARALYNGGEILLLDEATSAMDAKLEESVMGQIIKSNFKTIIAITHKPSMLKYFDQIYVFNDGVIEAHGTYGELKDKNYFFNKMTQATVEDVNVQ